MMKKLCNEKACMPSRNHNNRKPYNWLIYDGYDKFLIKNVEKFGGVVYDLGCGEMPYKKFFQQYIERYVGVDWSESFHKTKADIVADLNKPLPIDSKVADIVVSFSVLEHLYEPQIMLSEAFRILKPSGKIMVQVPWQWWVHEAPFDYYRFTPYGLKYLFEKVGFSEVLVEASSGFFTMWFLKFNYFSARFILGPKFLQFFIKALLSIVWAVLQTFAPLLDRLDRNWLAESTGYWVTAQKASDS